MKINKDMQSTFFLVWIVVLNVNQIFIFNACFDYHCLISALPHTGAISIFITYFYFKRKDKEKGDKSKDETKTPPKRKSYQRSSKTKKRDTYKKQSTHSFKKQLGDDYEKFIGKKLEEKGDVLVVYNGFIRGYEDKGMDLIVVSPKEKAINLVQCKYWVRKEITLDDVVNIYNKLDVHYNNLDLFYLSNSEVYNHLQMQNMDMLDVDRIMNDLRDNIANYTMRKSLYAASEKVVNLAIGEHLKMIKPNIFRYKEMKVVFSGAEVSTSEI